MSRERRPLRSTLSPRRRSCSRTSVSLFRLLPPLPSRLRDRGSARGICSVLTRYGPRTVKKFSDEVVAPKVAEMDENEKMDPAIIKGLFEQGVSVPTQARLERDNLTNGERAARAA
jgi:hypothetical protein